MAPAAQTTPIQSLGEQATKLAAAGWVQTDGLWFDPARPGSLGVVADKPSPFTREDWADYDAGRPERCQPDLMAREARRVARDRDGF